MACVCIGGLHATTLDGGNIFKTTPAGVVHRHERETGAVDSLCRISRPRQRLMTPIDNSGIVCACVRARMHACVMETRGC